MRPEASDMNPPLEVALASLVAFVAGSLPFAPWAVRLATKGDLRAVGDGNPGATNAFRAGGPALGVAVLLLDVTKGVLPVVFARDVLDLAGGAVALVAVLAVAGAAWSPFLGFAGGKGLAVTLGTWIGWTLWSIPLVALASVVVATRLVAPDGWAVAIALAAMLAGTLLWVPGAWASVALLGQAAIVLWKHRAQLAQRPRARRAGPRAA